MRRITLIVRSCHGGLKRSPAAHVVRATGVRRLASGGADSDTGVRAGDSSFSPRSGGGRAFEYRSGQAAGQPPSIPRSMTVMKDQPKSVMTVRAAIYARVSSEQQAQQSTIASQIAALRERIHADGLTLEDDLCFLDDGYSGGTLVRPALERLRDVAWAGGFTRLYVHSPDRLARRYAWQVLLVEELQRSGIELVFLNRTIGVRPEEDLLFQMQGMIAGYEQGQIIERRR